MIIAVDVTGSAVAMDKGKYRKGEHVIYDDRRIAKIVEPETEKGNARIAYYDAFSGEEVRMWVDVRAIRRTG